MQTDNVQLARETFKWIADRFPSLETSIYEGEMVDLLMDIPEQKDMKFKICLYLDNNDELHINAGKYLWLKWFPCTNPERVEQFTDAVCGLISGHYRILEHYRGIRAVKAELQVPDEENWKTIGVWSTFHIPIPWEKRFKIISNAQ